METMEDIKNQLIPMWSREEKRGLELVNIYVSPIENNKYLSHVIK